jgi:hypothetical protein
MILDPHFLGLRRQALDTLREVALAAGGIVTGGDGLPRGLATLSAPG